MVTKSDYIDRDHSVVVSEESRMVRSETAGSDSTSTARNDLH